MGKRERVVGVKSGERGVKNMVISKLGGEILSWWEQKVVGEGGAGITKVSISKITIMLI